MKIKIDNDDYYVYVSDEVENGKRLVNGNSYTFNLTIKNTLLFSKGYFFMK